MTPDPFDPETLRLTENSPKFCPDPQLKKPPRHRSGEKFLKGPIPLLWLIQAGRLPGKALHVGLLL
jgi:hypothetical protein